MEAIEHEDHEVPKCDHVIKRYDVLDIVPFQQLKFLKFASIEFPYIEVGYNLEVRGSGGLS